MWWGVEIVDLLATVYLDDEGHDEDGEGGARETHRLVALPVRKGW